MVLVGAQLEARFALRVALQAATVGVSIAAPTTTSIVASVEESPDSVVLFDLDLTGHRALWALGELSPQIRTVAWSSAQDETSVLTAVRAGVCGYLLEDEPVHRVVEALTDAAAGAHPFSSRVAGILIAQARGHVSMARLSDRELELARELATGATYAECARRMNIALGTVQDYVKRIYRKLSVSSKRELRNWLSLHSGTQRRCSGAANAVVTDSARDMRTAAHLS
ncbi:MAG: response regulator transcription factor [Polyangia bacterium]